MFILKYKEWLLSMENDAVWVYDLCKELPRWSRTKKDYIFSREPKRIDAREAKKIIEECGLVCVYTDEEGQKIYAKNESKDKENTKKCDNSL